MAKNRLPRKAGDSPSKGDLIKFARKLARVNTMLWNAIGFSEDLVKDALFKTLTDGEHDEYLYQFGGIFRGLRKNDDELVEVELYSSYFQDFDYLRGKLIDIMDMQA